MTPMIDLYLKRAGEILREGHGIIPSKNDVEWGLLIEKIKQESSVLTMAQRNVVLERFFELWDYQRNN